MSVKKCPLCRFDRAYTETTTVRGMDDFLKTLNDVIMYQPDPNDSGNIGDVSASGDES